MQIDILTLFPEMFVGPFDMSILRRAQDKLLVDIKVHNLRDWATDKHKTVDDRPYGGGVGMIMRVDVVDSALKDLKTKKLKNRQSQVTSHKSHVVLLSPQGKVFTQTKARELSNLEHLILICGHYEGVDQRVADYLIDEEISIGEYVLTGGELPAMIITDTIVRLIPGVLEKEAVENESFSKWKMENGKWQIRYDYPSYTRPPSYKNWEVPIVLQSGNHKEINAWRQKKSLEKSSK